jgi:hypothetical protein
MSTPRKTANKTAKTPAPTKLAKPSPRSGVALPLGAHAKNTGGKPGRSGRPVQAFRDALFGDLEERRQFAASVVDGTPMQRIRVRVASLAPFVACATCGGSEVRPIDGEAAEAEISVEASASPKDRLNALDWMAKYSVGTVKEVSVDNVRDRLDRTLDLIQARVSPEQFALLVAELQPVWTT